MTAFSFGKLVSYGLCAFGRDWDRVVLVTEAESASLGAGPWPSGELEVFCGVRLRISDKAPAQRFTKPIPEGIE